MPGYHRGRAPRNKAEQAPGDPPTIEEIIEVMRTIRERSGGFRLGALIVLLWRAGLRISEALALRESHRWVGSRRRWGSPAEAP
jgi:integrase